VLVEFLPAELFTAFLIAFYQPELYTLHTILLMAYEYAIAQ